jgi:hypothetical protein
VLFPVHATRATSCALNPQITCPYLKAFALVPFARYAPLDIHFFMSLLRATLSTRPVHLE